MCATVIVRAIHGMAGSTWPFIERQVLYKGLLAALYGISKPQEFTHSIPKED